MTPARRGDIVIVQTTRRAIVLGKGAMDYDRFHVGVVTNITRDGAVRKWREVGTETVHPIDRAIGYVQHWVVSKPRVRVDDVLRAAAEHTWPGHPNQPRPFDSPDEIKALLRQFDTGREMAL